MLVITTKQFRKDALKELSKDDQLLLATIIQELQKAESVPGFPNLKKLKGFKNAFRIKMGDYRICFLSREQTIYLSRVLHRGRFTVIFPNIIPASGAAQIPYPDQINTGK